MRKYFAFGLVFFCLGACAWAQPSAGAGPTATPIGPPERKQGYYLSIGDRVAEQYRRIRVALKAGQLTRDQGLALRIKLQDFDKQAQGDRKNGGNEPSADIQKSRWEQITSIAREIDREIAKSNKPAAK
jgi:hypothetical protein